MIMPQHTAESGQQPPLLQGLEVCRYRRWGRWDQVSLTEGPASPRHGIHVARYGSMRFVLMYRCLIAVHAE
ncbi:hypothetical protein NDU88_004092 [Pleurodeles waltl]|uniref:Uncharacterized protein n=1 Tax=Pleurodeles waltl TaxID=8319 RepID=A0AAV7V204_PLEWA|nr:hypothetical protein NDU88_004092 [Pleurodeles waltl]